MKKKFNFEAWNSKFEFMSILQIYQHFLALQGVWAQKLNFIFILQIYQDFWLYKGSGLSNWILFSFYKSTKIFGLVIEFYFHTKMEYMSILQIYQHFWLYKGSGHINLIFISILQIYKHFWLYRGFGLRTWNLCPFYKSSNIFGSTRGLG